jgi:TetR/AcrR family transcriptional regulator, transcriptional repressor for nem operon
MRASREVTAQHHDEIVSMTSKMLRGRGVHRTSVVDLMRAAGLTHGGFYRHFKSKDELIAQSTRNIFRAIILRFQARSAKEGPKAALAAYVEDYLAGRHVRVPEEGCPVAAYGAEAARESRAVREAFAEGMDQMLSLAAEGLSCPKEQGRARAAELQALITGAVVMARAAGSSKLSREILHFARRRAEQMIEERR